MTTDAKRHILVITDPPVAPGYLPRVRFLCDFLVQNGFAVTLLTEQGQPLDFAHTYPIETIPMYSGNSFDWFIKTVWTLLTDWHNRVFAKKSLQLSAISHQSWDFVLCSAFSDFPLGAAQRIASKLNIPLVCDIRDLDEQVLNSRYQYHHRSAWLMPFRRLYRAVHIRRRNRVLRAANAVTTVSKWHADFIRNILTAKRSNGDNGLKAKRSMSDLAAVSIIYNGFDDRQFYPEDIRTDRFTITYIGNLFDWQKEALEKVQQAIEEINRQFSIFKKSCLEGAKNFQFSINLHTPKSRPVAHDALGDAIRQSSIMLVLTNTDTHGMLTTKFYEALGCAKPVLCVPSDKGELTELISHTNAGIATGDTEQIKTFILAKYKEWQDFGFTRQPVVHREEFSRTKQCEQLINILNTIFK